MTVITASAQVEKRRAASTAKGLPSAPSSREAAARSRARGGKAPSHPPLAARGAGGEGGGGQGPGPRAVGGQVDGVDERGQRAAGVHTHRVAGPRRQARAGRG